MVEQIVEEVVQVPKIVMQEEVIQRQVEQQVVVPRYVDRIEIQEVIRQVPVPVIQKQIVEVPKIQTVEEVVVQPVEQVQVVPKQVDKLTVVQRVRNKKVQQPVRTVEVVQENIVERIVECRKPIIQEQVVSVPR